MVLFALIVVSSAIVLSRSSLALVAFDGLATTTTTATASVVSVVSSSASSTATGVAFSCLTASFAVLSITVLQDFALVNRNLVADIVGVERLLTQFDLEHSHDSGELKVVKSFFKRLVFVVDGDVGDPVDLVESLHAVLDELAKLDG